MRIELKGGKYLITSDPHNVVLSERKTYKDGEKAGEEYPEPIGYYPNLTRLVESLVEREVRLSGATTLTRLAADIKAIKVMVRETLTQIKEVS